MAYSKPVVMFLGSATELTNGSIMGWNYEETCSSYTRFWTFFCP